MSQPKFDAVNFSSDITKEALKKHWGEKIVIATANFIMVQIFIEGLKPKSDNQTGYQMIVWIKFITKLDHFI
jgi:hypothetical protein